MENRPLVKGVEGAHPVYYRGTGPQFFRDPYLVPIVFIAGFGTGTVVAGTGAATDSAVILQAGSYVLFLVVLMFVMLCGCGVGVDCGLL